mmetsp:Transcript_126621/g.405391  ORF Transcript_126621/g.405391 Transcript_126621/m.405391 type:complete len:279 (+) Transcript_126621:951-1787(+)
MAGGVVAELVAPPANAAEAEGEAGPCSKAEEPRGKTQVWRKSSTLGEATSQFKAFSTCASVAKMTSTEYWCWLRVSKISLNLLGLENSSAPPDTFTAMLTMAITMRCNCRASMRSVATAEKRSSKSTAAWITESSKKPAHMKSQRMTRSRSSSLIPVRTASATGRCRSDSWCFARSTELQRSERDASMACSGLTSWRACHAVKDSLTRSPVRSTAGAAGVAGAAAAVTITVGMGGGAMSFVGGGAAAAAAPVRRAPGMTGGEGVGKWRFCTTTRGGGV